MPEMVTSIGRKSQLRRLYIAEWRKHKGVTVEQVAGRMGVHANTVKRYQREQWRLNTPLLHQFASAIGLDDSNDFYQPPPPPGEKPSPERTSLDKMLKDVPVEDRALASELAADVIRRMTKKSA